MHGLCAVGLRNSSVVRMHVCVLEDFEYLSVQSERWPLLQKCCMRFMVCNIQREDNCGVVAPVTGVMSGGLRAMNPNSMQGRSCCRHC